MIGNTLKTGKWLVCRHRFHLAPCTVHSYWHICQMHQLWELGFRLWPAFALHTVSNWVPGFFVWSFMLRLCIMETRVEGKTKLILISHHPCSLFTLSECRHLSLLWSIYRHAIHLLCIIFDWRASCCSCYLWILLSSLYGKLVVVLMLAFCVTEVMDNSVKLLSLQVWWHTSDLRLIILSSI